MKTQRRRGSILILFLWLVLVLGIFGITYSASVKSQLDAFEKSRGRREAYWAARAGVEKAMVMLEQADLALVGPADPLLDSPDDFQEQEVGPATFSIVADPVEEDEEPRFGLIDCASRLNINGASEATLMLLPGMTIDNAQALLDWRDGNDEAREVGAEVDYYMSLEEPTVPRNQALRSLRELLRVRGWNEYFAAAYPDPYARFASEPPLPTEFDPIDSRLLLGRITVWSAEDNLAPDNEQKLDLASASEDDILRRVPGISQEEARAIVQFRNGGGYRRVTDLLNVTEPQEGQNSQSSQQNARQGGQQGSSDGRGGQAARGGGQGGGRGGQSANQGNRGGGQAGGRGGQSANQSNRGGGNQGNRGGGGAQQAGAGQSRTGSQGSQANRGGQGARVFTLDRTGQIIDYFRLGGGNNSQAPGKININSASYEVLMTVQNMTEDLALAIIQQRESAGRIEGAGAIASMGVTTQQFHSVYPRLTGRSSRYMVSSRGHEASSGAVAEIEAVLSAGADGVRIIHWSER